MNEMAENAFVVTNIIKIFKISLNLELLEREKPLLDGQEILFKITLNIKKTA